MSLLRRFAAPSTIGMAFALAACDLAPPYTPPAVSQPTAYKEDGDWKAATPAANVPRGTWWTVFRDSELDALEAHLDAGNQTLKQALARYEESAAQARSARSALFPQVTGTVAANRQEKSRNIAVKTHPTLYNDELADIGVSYELDLWGRVRNTVASGKDRAQASADDLAVVSLALQAELANDYLALRGADAQQQVLDQTLEAYSAALALVRRRYSGGVAAAADVAQAEAQLETARTIDSDNRLQRAQLEHAIAVLVGEPASSFAFPVGPLTAQPPAMAPGLPSTLLERRPDIAEGERLVAAANADMGVARAAYFPVFTLSALAGFEAASPGQWLQAPSSLWALGPSTVVTLFDGGQRHAVNDQARAAYDAAVASYRQNVLEAYREVEDQLVALRRLEEEAGTAIAAVDATGRALDQAKKRYAGGLVTYLEVVSAQNAALAAQRTEVDIRTRRMMASVGLVKALGGGWGGDPDRHPMADTAHGTTADAG